MSGMFSVKPATRAAVNRIAFKAGVMAKKIGVPSFYNLGASVVGVAGNLLIKEYDNGGVRKAIDWTPGKRYIFTYGLDPIFLAAQRKMVTGDDKRILKEENLLTIAWLLKSFAFPITSFLTLRRLGLNYGKGLAAEGICSGRTFIATTGQRRYDFTMAGFMRRMRKAVSGDDTRVRKEENLAAITRHDVAGSAVSEDEKGKQVYKSKG